MTKAAQAMKKAWEIFKKEGIRTSQAWSAALRKAWAIVKGVVKEMVEQVIFETEKRGVEVKVVMVGENLEMRLDGEVYDTCSSLNGKKYAWMVVKEAAKKYFGVNKVAFIEATSAKEDFLNKTNENRKAWNEFKAQEKAYNKIGE